MSHEIYQQNIDGINRNISELGFIAKRGKVNPNEVIVGRDRDSKGAVTITLSGDHPVWTIGFFPETTPGDLSTIHDLSNELKSSVRAFYWADMLKEVRLYLTEL